MSALSPVVFSRAAGYVPDEIARAMRRQFDLLRIADAVRPGMRVLIKPNLLMRRAPEQFTTTHPMVVECAVRELTRLGVTEITVADSPGGPYTRAALEGVYRACGMDQAVNGTCARLNTDTGWGTRASEPGSSCASFNLIRPALDADRIINLPKLKAHGMVTLSAGVKNLFGCIPGLQKPEMHYRFPEEEAFCGMLVDLARTVAPAFTIVDAVVSMEGDGPSGGTARDTCFLAGSANPFALDAVLASLVGFEMVHTVRIAQERGLSLPANRISCIGDDIGPVPGFRPPKSKSLDFAGYVPRFLRPAARKAAAAFAKPRPQVSARRCVGCLKCRESCPAHTIQVRDGKAYILPNGCIRCFCCHEMCPVKAIRIRRFGLFRF